VGGRGGRGNGPNGLGDLDKKNQIGTIPETGGGNFKKFGGSRERDGGEIEEKNGW